VKRTPNLQITSWGKVKAVSLSEDIGIPGEEKLLLVILKKLHKNCRESDYKFLARGGGDGGG